MDEIFESKQKLTYEEACVYIDSLLKDLSDEEEAILLDKITEF